MNSVYSFPLESVIQRLKELGKQARYFLKDTELDKTKKRSLVNPDNYETELIQVAAVAVAALTDYRMQHSDRQKTLIEQRIWQDILKERERQDKKFERRMPVGLDPCIWGLVLIEETAEVMAEVEMEEGGDRS